MSCTMETHEHIPHILKSVQEDNKNKEDTRPTTSARACSSDEITAVAVARVAEVALSEATAANDRANGVRSLASGTQGLAR